MKRALDPRLSTLDLKQAIARACRESADDSDVIPIKDPTFTKCAQAISSACHNHSNATLAALPSEMLPLLP